MSGGLQPCLPGLDRHRKSAKLKIADIQREVADFFDVAEIEMVSARRSRSVARPRQVAMCLARDLTPKSLPDIGRRFGGRDHTTVIHAIRTVEHLCAIDAEFDEDFQACRARVLDCAALGRTDA